MSFVAVAIGGAALVGAGAAIYSANEQKNAIKDTNKKNAANVANTNAVNKYMFHEGRGASGHAFLPEYFGDFEGDVLAKDAMENYNRYRETPATYQSYADAAARYTPLFNEADAVATGIFTGQTERDLLGNLAPVAGARTRLSRQAYFDAVNGTLAQIEAANALKGYAGDSLAKQRLTFDARRQAGDAMAGAELMNLEDTRKIKDQAVSLKLQNIGLPLTLAEQRGRILTLPQDMAASAMTRRLAPFQFFNIGPSAFQNKSLPEVQPVTSTSGLVAQGAAQLGGTALNAYLEDRYAQSRAPKIYKFYGSGTTTAPAGSFGQPPDYERAAYGAG